MKAEFAIRLGTIAPMGKPSVRSSSFGKKHYFPPKYKQYCGLVGLLINRQRSEKESFGKCATKVSVEFHFVKEKVGKPDIDNLLKSLFDIITDLGIWAGDEYICDLTAKKLYCAQEHRILLWITKLPSEK